MCSNDSVTNHSSGHIIKQRFDLSHREKQFATAMESEFCNDRTMFDVHNSFARFMERQYAPFSYDQMSLPSPSDSLGSSSSSTPDSSVCGNAHAYSGGQGNGSITLLQQAHPTQDNR